MKTFINAPVSIQHFFPPFPRVRLAEWMDAPDADPGELRRSLAFIQRINRFLGYNRATLGHLKRFSRRWGPSQKVRILDVATGSADFPLEILRWVDRVNRKRGWQWDVRVVGIDLHSETLAAARQEIQKSGNESGRPRIALVQADALALPFPDQSFDYAITSMFLHHLSDDDVVRVIAGMNRVVQRGIVVADLLRHRRAYAWISLLTLFSNSMVRHDARVSVRQAFTKAEVLRMRGRAGVRFAAYHRHFGHRFVIAGERGEKMTG
jgi:ubiquinone/menaquinone biosynthesis C-methylase UbiE